MTGLAFPKSATVEVGQGVLRIDDERMAPFLWPRDLAIIDYTDREISDGEIYLVLTGGPRLWKVERRRYNGNDGSPEEPLYDLCPGVRYTRAGLTRMFAEGRKVHFSEGPIYEKHLREKILGRVVAIYDPNFHAPAVLNLPEWLQST